MRGLGALGVIAGHAVLQVFDREALLLAQSPNAGYTNYVGTAEHHLLFAVRQLALFAVPMFVFVSGLVRAYGVAQGKPVQWSSIRRWIAALIPPFVIGLVVIWLAFFGPVLLAHNRAIRLEEMLGTYDLVAFLPIAIEFYLLFPLLVRVAQRSPEGLLMGAALVQGTVIAAWYVSRGNTPYATALAQYVKLSEYHLWSRMLYFCGGVVIGLHHKRALPQLVQWRGLLVGLAVAFGALSVLEMERTSPLGGMFASQFLVPAVAYFLCLSLLVASWAGAPDDGPLQRFWQAIGQRSLGIYILQWAVMLTTARIASATYPVLVMQPVAFFFGLCIVALVAPLFVSSLLARAKLNRLHRYIFGSSH
ncbi:MAG: acyltransferase [Anaerolineae bacterium]|nr:acyltransferase [Anaerolineae bacterium]